MTVVKARVSFSAAWDEFVEVEVPDDADEFDAERLRELAVERHGMGSAHVHADIDSVEWSGDPEFAPNKPDDPPPEAWGMAHGQRWATDGHLAIREDCPIRPAKARDEQWKVPAPSFLGILLPRSATRETCPEGLCLPSPAVVRPDASVRQLQLLALGDITYSDRVAYVWRPGESMPIAFVALCRADR